MHNASGEVTGSSKNNPTDIKVMQSISKKMLRMYLAYSSPAGHKLRSATEWLYAWETNEVGV